MTKLEPRKVKYIQSLVVAFFGYIYIEMIMA